MVTLEHAIVQAVYAAKTDTAAADAFVQQYLPFVRAETVRFTRQAIEQGHEDELSIALLAFLRGDPQLRKGARGLFALRRAGHPQPPDRPFPRRAPPPGPGVHAGIRRRGRPHAGRHPARPGMSWTPASCAWPAARRSPPSAHSWSSNGICFSDVADKLPPGSSARWTPAAGCWTTPGQTRRCWTGWCRPAACPWRELAQGSGVDKKTMERHRRNLFAILLAFTNGYEIIRGHLCQLAPRGKEGAMTYLVMETHPAYAVVLDEAGRFPQGGQPGLPAGATG